MKASYTTFQSTKEATAKYKSQLAIVPAASIRYVAMNTTVKPFDNVNVRKAVSVAIPIQVTPEFPTQTVALVVVALGAVVIAARRNSNNFI